MDATAAALIGAGVGAVVAIASQYLGHELSLKRDRRSQRRQRLTEVIVEAATALYAPLDPDERKRDEEDFEKWKADLDPDSVAATDPESLWDLIPFHDATFRGMVLLQIHFGHDHWLLDRYMDACVTCAVAESAKSLHFRSNDEEWRIKNIPALAEKAREGQMARDNWMKLAREEIERI